MVDVRIQEPHAAKRLLYNCHLKWTFEELFPCNCYGIKPNRRTSRSQVSQPASAGEEADMSELQAYHCMTPKQW